MRTPALAVVFSLSTVVLAGCGKAGAPSAGDAPKAAALTAGEVHANNAKYEGKKVTVKGVYTQGYSAGGRPGNPWALVVKDEPKAEGGVSCLIPESQDRTAVSKGSYPKVTVEGTVETEKGSPVRVNLVGCTFKLD